MCIIWLATTRHVYGRDELSYGPITSTEKFDPTLGQKVCYIVWGQRNRYPSSVMLFRFIIIIPEDMY